MHHLGVVHRSVDRADPAAVEALSRFGVATVHEAMGRLGLMRPYIRPVYEGAKLCGTAVTVLLQPGDNWMLHVAAEQVREGDVVVAAAPPRARTASSGSCSPPRCVPAAPAAWSSTAAAVTWTTCAGWTSPCSPGRSTPRAPSRPPWVR